MKIQHWILLLFISVVMFFVFNVITIATWQIIFAYADFVFVFVCTAIFDYYDNKKITELEQKIKKLEEKNK